MKNRFSFFLWGLIIFQLLTALFHSLSFVMKPKAENETEKQLIDLVYSYHKDYGMGFHPSMGNLFLALSTCFTFICLLGGISNIYFKNKRMGMNLWSGWLLIQTLIFGAIFLVMLAFTFIYPVVLSGLVFLFALLTWLSSRKHISQP